MTTPSSSGIQVSFEQIYSEVRLLHDAMARIETKLDNVSGLEPRVRDLENLAVKEKLGDFEGRLRSLEERRLPHQLLGVVSAILGTAALIWQAVNMK